MNSNNEYEQVKKDFLSGRIKGCKTYFENHNYNTEAAYCCLVLDETEKVEEFFNKAKTYDNRACWGLFLLQMITGEIKSSPTYFQIRNFLELDLNILQKMLDLLLTPCSYVVDSPILVTTYCCCDLPPEEWPGTEARAEQRWTPELLAETLGEIPDLEQYSLRLDLAAQYVYEIMRRLQPVVCCYVPVHSTDIFEGD